LFDIALKKGRLGGRILAPKVTCLITYSPDVDKQIVPIPNARITSQASVSLRRIPANPARSGRKQR